jgi:histidinol-phosphate aminotransferase
VDNFAIEHIKKMDHYAPPLDGRSNFDGLLLDFNERTTPVNPKILEAIKNYANSEKTQVYPEYFKITEELADYSNVDPNQIMITNGGDQGIDIIFRTYTEKDDSVIIPSPSFAMFYQCAGITGNNVVKPAYLKGDLAYPLQSVLDSINSETKLVIICNPNNPTGTMLNLEEIKTVLDKALTTKTFVLIDEAYFEFTKVTASSFINSYPNLAIIRTFSKPFGMPGLRFGYVISSSTNITEMLKVRGPYDINTISVLAASAALQDTSYVDNYVDEVMNKAKPMVESFLNEIGMTYVPSKANFMLIKPKNAPQLFDILKKNGILTRPRSGVNIENTLRISIGTVEQMQRFIQIYKSCILD